MATVEQMLGKTGGFMKGVCHPGQDRELLLAAGLCWVRRDIPYPLTAGGELTDGYKAYKKACEYYTERGIGTIGITPYPRAFIEAGIDVREPENLPRAAEVCAFLACDLAGMVRCFQVTNEMHILQFRAPLEEAQSMRFIIACTRGVRQGDPSAAVGHNSVDEHWLPLCREIERETGGTDYAGLDCYDGTWGVGGPYTYVEKFYKVYEQTGRPVVLMFFGFATKGGFIDHQNDEIGKYLKSRGFRDFDDVEARMEEYIATLPAPMAETARRCSPEDRRRYVRGGWEHLLKKWYSTNPIVHTPEGQAEFYRRLLPKLLSHPKVCGAILYCWQDSRTCFTCGADDCPCETAWGLLDCDGNPKPGYFAVKECFTKESELL